MLLEQHKNSPITTDQSWYTPHKHKNVSSIETNPSMNVVNFQSNQYSSIELSQSLAESPSFLSPNKELGSFLMTPNYSSKQMLPSGSESIGDMRLRTQSLVDTSRFQDITNESKKSLSQMNSSEVKQVMKLINEIRSVKAIKTYHSRKINQQTQIQSFLLKQISDKQQSILAHKLIVEQKIQKKNKLNNKLKEKKIKIKAKTDKFINNLQTKIYKLREEFQTACSLLNLQSMKIGRFQNQLYHINAHMQQYKHSQYLMHQNQKGNDMMQSQAQQMNYQKIPGFYSNPSSSRSQNHRKNSSEEIQKSGQQKSGQQKSAAESNLSIEDLLRIHFSSKIGKGQSNQQKLRKFSFGQNPSFFMQGLEGKNDSGNISPKNSGKFNSNNGNLLMQALAMKVQQVTSQNLQQNPQSTSPQKRFEQNSGPFITQQFENISPIVSPKKISFNKQLEKPSQKKQIPQKNNQFLSDRNEFRQIIQQLDGKQDQSQFELQYFNESVIDINDDPMLESKYKNNPRLNFNKKQSQSPQHKRTQSGQTAKRSIKLPLVLEQSIVNIACESSTYSDNLQYHDFSPIKQEEVKRRLRSPTHQVMPAIHEDMYDLRKTQNKLKGSNKQGDSGKHSGGADTPIFRSQVSEEQQNLVFSRAFLGGSMKESQILQDQEHTLKESKMGDKQKLTPQKQNQQRSYRTTLLNESKKSQPYSIYQTQNLRKIQTDEQDAIEQIEQSDDDFFSCTLGTQSKVFVQSTIKSRESNDQVEFKSNKNEGNKMKSSRSLYNKEKQQHEQSKNMNLVLENVRNKNYDMSLNLSELGNRKYENKEKRVSLGMDKKEQSVELQRNFNGSSQSFIERYDRQDSQRVKGQSRSTF